MYGVFPPQKRKPRTSPNPLSENPHSATHEKRPRRALKSPQSALKRPDFRKDFPPIFSLSQQLAYGVVSEGCFWQKVCGNSAESSWKLCFIAPGKGAEILQKFRRDLQKISCNDPFPNDPISELLIKPPFVSPRLDFPKIEFLFLTHTGAPKSRNMLGNSLPVVPAQETTENYLKDSGCQQ